MFRFLLLVALASSAYAYVLEFTECAGGLPKPMMVSKDDCNTSPCNLIRGTTTTFYTLFVAPSATSTLRASVQDINGEYSLPIDQQNGCSNLYGATCPMNEGEHGQWDLALPIGNDLAGSSLRFTLYGDGDSVVTCFNMAVNIV